MGFAGEGQMAVLEVATGKKLVEGAGIKGALAWSPAGTRSVAILMEPNGSSHIRAYLAQGLCGM